QTFDGAFFLCQDRVRVHARGDPYSGKGRYAITRLGGGTLLYALLVASFPQPRSFSYWPQEKATAVYESGGVRKIRRTPVHSLTQKAGDRRVFWLGCSGCTARAWSSFVPLLQAVRSIGKTRNQLDPRCRFETSR